MKYALMIAGVLYRNTCPGSYDEGTEQALRIYVIFIERRENKILFCYIKRFKPGDKDHYLVSGHDCFHWSKKGGIWHLNIGDGAAPEEKRILQNISATEEEKEIVKINNRRGAEIQGYLKDAKLIFQITLNVWEKLEELNISYGEQS